MTLVDLEVQPDLRKTRILIISDYCYLSALEEDVEFFTKRQSDALFEQMNKQEVEMICNSVISGLVKANKDLRLVNYTDVESFNSRLQEKDKLHKINTLLLKVYEVMKREQSRSQMFMTILIDKLVIIRQNRQQSKPKSIEDLQLAIRLFSIN